MPGRKADICRAVGAPLEPACERNSTARCWVSHDCVFTQHEVEVLQHTEAIQAELGGLGLGGEPVSLLSSIDGVHLNDIPLLGTAAPTTAHTGRPHICIYLLHRHPFATSDGDLALNYTEGFDMRRFDSQQ